MPYAIFDDGFADHPKVEALSSDAFRLHVAGILYCARLLTDGVIPKARIARLVPAYRPRHLDELLRSLWHPQGHSCPSCPQPGADAVVVHDYLVTQRSKAQVMRERERAAERQRRRRDNAGSNAVTTGVTHAAQSNPTQSDDVPPQPPAERGERTRRRRTAAPALGVIPGSGALRPVEEVIAGRGDRSGPRPNFADRPLQPKEAGA